MVHGKNRIPYWIDRSLTGLAGPDYDASISIGLPFEPEYSQYGGSRVESPNRRICSSFTCMFTYLQSRLLHRSHYAEHS